MSDVAGIRALWNRFRCWFMNLINIKAGNDRPMLGEIAPRRAPTAPTPPTLNDPLTEKTPPSTPLTPNPE
jgi:hypothetical protein